MTKDVHSASEFGQQIVRHLVSRFVTRSGISISCVEVFARVRREPPDDRFMLARLDPRPDHLCLDPLFCQGCHWVPGI